MEENRNNYLGGLVQRAMEDERLSAHTGQNGTSTQEKPRTRGAGEEGQPLTRTRPDEVGSVGTAGGQSAAWDSDAGEVPYTSSRGGGPVPHAKRRDGSGQSAVYERQTNAGNEKSKAGGQKTSGRKSKGAFLKGLISGTVISDSIILKDVRYSALIVMLAIIFIANRFNAERVEREIAVLEQEVRDLRAEALSVSADLGSVSRQSEITQLVKERGLGLEELREPPYRIVVNE